MNAPKLTAHALQALMRHKSRPTTQRHINVARQLSETAEALYVPEVVRKAS